VLKVQPGDAPPSDQPASAASQHRPRWRQVGDHHRRGLIVAALFVLGALIYAAIIVKLDVSEEASEREFGVPATQSQIALYLQPIAIDALNSSMQLRLSVMPPPSHEAVQLNVATREMVLVIHRGSQTQQLNIHVHQPLPEITVDLDLDGGSIRNYPLDRYQSAIQLSCLEVTEHGVGAAVPMHITHWEGVLGYNVQGQEAATSNARETAIQFNIDRTGAVRFFGLAAYAAMLMLACYALTIGTFVFIGVRSIEVTLIGALGAIIFALPALRNVMPGAPPLGVRADILIYFWAELSAVVALGLFVAAWAYRGSRPDRKKP
jgi:Domain of unknown function (DUF4436)